MSLRQHPNKCKIRIKNSKTRTIVPVNSCAFLVITLQGEMIALVSLIMLVLMLEKVKILINLKAKN